MKKFPKRNLSLPDGKITTSVRRYLKAWGDLIKPIEAKTGYKCTAFNPGLMFSKLTPAHDGLTRYSPSFTLPVEFAEALVESWRLYEELVDTRPRYALP